MSDPIRVIARKQGAWWMVEIPELGGLTQARRLDEVAQMAREYVALMHDLQSEDVRVDVTVATIGSVADVGARVASIAEKRRRAAQLEQEASSDASALATLLSKELTMREIGAVLGLSHQRVHQLITR